MIHYVIANLFDLSTLTMSEHLASPTPHATAIEIANALKAKGDPCRATKEFFMMHQYAHLLQKPAAGPGGAAGASAADARPTCLICSRGIDDHRDLTELDLDLSGGKKSILGKRSAAAAIASRSDLDRLIKRPRIFGPADPSETSDLTDRPFAHITGLVAAQRSLAIALEAEANAAPGDSFKTALFAGDPTIQKADAPAIVNRLHLRADGLALALAAMKAHYDWEFKKLEDTNTDLKVFFPTVKEIVSSWTPTLAEIPDADSCDFAALARAVRTLNQDKAQELHKTLFLTKIKTKSDAELDRLKTLAKARAAASRAAAPAPAPAPAPASAAAAPPAPSPALRTGRNGNPPSGSLACLTCRSLGHLANNCPDSPPPDSGKGGKQDSGKAAGKGFARGAQTRRR